MTFVHFVDQNGVHWVFNVNQLLYATVNVIDGSQPVQLFFVGRTQPFMMSLALFETLTAGVIPAAVAVTV
jgi:hypothetical protein